MTEPHLYGLLADATVVLHLAFVLFVVGGQALILVGWCRGWSWTRSLLLRISHLAAIALVTMETWAGIPCPLTVLENRLRLRAGASPYAQSFIGYWLDRLLFYTAPEWVFGLIYSAFGALVLITFLAYPPRLPLR
jgi:hypothetical protein